MVLTVEFRAMDKYPRHRYVRNDEMQGMEAAVESHHKLEALGVNMSALQVKLDGLYRGKEGANLKSKTGRRSCQAP